MAKNKSLNGGDKSRNFYLIGGFFGLLIVAIVITWVVSFASKSSNEPTATRINKTPNREKVTTEQNQAYVKQLDGYNMNKGSTAIVKGASWISIPAYYSEEVKKPVVAATSNGLTFDVAPQYIQASVGSKPAAIARKEAEDLIKAIESSWNYSAPTDAESKDVAKYASTFMPDVAANPVLTAAASDLTPAISPFKIYDALKLCPAKLLTQLDTNTNSIVRAKLMCKELANATILAPGYKLVGEDIDMSFSLMSYRDKNDRIAKTYKIQAKPVDLDTGRSMLTGRVDNHYIRRILIPALSMGVAKVGKLYEENTKETSYVSNGTVVTNNDGKVSSEQVKGTFFGGLAQQTADVLKADNARTPPIQVTREDQPTFGVIFLMPVMSTDIVEKSLNTTPPNTYTQPAAQSQVEMQTKSDMGINASGPIFNSASAE